MVKLDVPPLKNLEEKQIHIVLAGEIFQGVPHIPASGPQKALIQNVALPVPLLMGILREIQGC